MEASTAALVDSPRFSRRSRHRALHHRTRLPAPRRARLDDDPPGRGNRTHLQPHDRPPRRRPRVNHPTHHRDRALDRHRPRRHLGRDRPLLPDQLAGRLLRRRDQRHELRRRTHMDLRAPPPHSPTTRRRQHATRSRRHQEQRLSPQPVQVRYLDGARQPTQVARRQFARRRRLGRASRAVTGTVVGERIKAQGTSVPAARATVPVDTISPSTNPTKSELVAL